MNHESDLTMKNEFLAEYTIINKINKLLSILSIIVTSYWKHGDYIHAHRKQ